MLLEIKYSLSKKIWTIIK